MGALKGPTCQKYLSLLVTMAAPLVQLQSLWIVAGYDQSQSISASRLNVELQNTKGKTPPKIDSDYGLTSRVPRVLAPAGPVQVGSYTSYPRPCLPSPTFLFGCGWDLEARIIIKKTRFDRSGDDQRLPPPFLPSLNVARKAGHAGVQAFKTAFVRYCLAAIRGLGYDLKFVRLVARRSRSRKSTVHHIHRLVHDAAARPGGYNHSLRRLVCGATEQPIRFSSINSKSLKMLLLASDHPGLRPKTCLGDLLTCFHVRTHLFL
ncbi:hypothetical protein H4582DRAFT_529959 [Lactarius indigo]|nr:hypothetical protein H4582DRAFT_529959 [Lactarius indigo]